MTKQSPKLPIIPCQTGNTQCSDLIGRPKMEAINYWGYNSIQCRLIDSGILIPLALIDLLKPYFLIIGGFTLGNVSQGRR